MDNSYRSILAEIALLLVTRREFAAPDDFQLGGGSVHGFLKSSACSI
jgi:hypothetical protein